MQSAKRKLTGSWWRLALAANTVLLGAGTISAQCPPEGWVPGQGPNGVNSTVRAVTVWDDGGGPALYVGGLFTSADGAPANGIARWNGSTWQALGAGVSGDFAHVFALAIYNGELIAGGSFTGAGGMAASRIARWNGSTWQALGSGLNDVVYALTVFNGELIAGGRFTDAGGATVDRIARWNGSVWAPLASGGVQGADPGNLPGVFALAVYNNQLIAGGHFTSAGGAMAHHIARWDGSAWASLASGVEGNPFALPGVYALAIYNGELVAGGEFTMAGGVAADHIARWNGSSWQTLGSGVNSTVSALAVYNGELIAGGIFYNAGGAPISYLARWNGALWQTLGGGVNGGVMALTVYGGELIAGGTFTIVDGVFVGVTANRIARWNGANWRTLGNGFNDAIFALTVYNGEQIAGGLLTTAGGVLANRIARWNGSTWSPLGSGMAGASPFYPPSVSALGVYNNELIAGGEFVMAGGVAASGIARWNGSSWQNLGSGISAFGSVSALTVYNGELVAGGSFNTAGGSAANSIARWNGANWQALGAGVNGSVAALTVYNGELIAAGSFNTAGGVMADNIARWNGSSWQTLGSGTNNFVFALAVYGGELIAGGQFTAVGGVTSNYIARWNSSIWQTLGAGMNERVRAFTVYNGELVAGGLFTMAGTITASRIARWNGSNWGAFGSGMNDSVYALAPYNADLTAGGIFTTAGGLNSAFLARWGGAGRTIVSANPPLDNPYVADQQPFRDVLQNTTTTLLARGIGALGTPNEGAVTYATISVTFDGTPSPSPAVGNINVCCTDMFAPAGGCPSVTGVSGSGSGPYTLTLSGAIPTRECTTIGFTGVNAAQKLQYQSLPGDVNFDGATNTQDLLSLVQRLNDGTANQAVNFARYNVDRSTQSPPVNTQDLLRLVQLLNGVNATEGFNGATVATCP